MENCPLDLSGQGQLLKLGSVEKRCIGGTFKQGRKWSFKQKSSLGHLLLFQKTIVLCKIKQNLLEPQTPHLLYEEHISVNQVRVRDVIADDNNTFEVHKLEHVKDKSIKKNCRWNSDE